MNDILLNLIVIFGTALVVGIILLVYFQRKRQREKRLIESAALRGWQINKFAEGNVSGFRLQGTEAGVAWTMEIATKSSQAASGSGSESNNQHYTRWWSGAASLPAGIVLIGEKPAGASGNFQIPEAVESLFMQKILRLMIGDDAQYIKGIHPVEAGTSVFRQRYLIWAQDHETAQKLVDGQVESGLLTWNPKTPLLVRLDDKGVQLEVRDHRLFQEEDLDQLVDLGRQLIANLELVE